MKEYIYVAMKLTSKEEALHSLYSPSNEVAS